jgi:hypothetical protein
MKTDNLRIAVESAMKKETEKERIIAILDCVRGYKNEYDAKTQKAEMDGFMKCKNEYRHQIKKILLILDDLKSEPPSSQFHHHH